MFIYIDNFGKYVILIIYLIYKKLGRKKIKAMDQTFYMLCLFFRLICKILAVMPTSPFFWKQLLKVAKYMIKTLSFDEFIRELERIDYFIDNLVKQGIRAKLPPNQNQ